MLPGESECGRVGEGKLAPRRLVYAAVTGLLGVSMSSDRGGKALFLNLPILSVSKLFVIKVFIMSLLPSYICSTYGDVPTLYSEY